METTLRHTDVKTLADTLNQMRTHSVDVVAHASKLSFRDGALVLDGVAPVLGDTGVTDVNGLYVPTTVGLDGVSGKLSVPRDYLNRSCAMAASAHNPDTLTRDSGDNVSLFDVLTNTGLREAAKADTSFLLRLLTDPEGPGTDGFDGALRAMLSDSYYCIDNFDVLLAALKGLREAGIVAPKIQADLTDRRMYVRVTCEQIGVHGRSLIKNYRSPYMKNPDGSAMTGEQLPMLWAGIEFSNSETGNGAFNLTPRAEFQICANGMAIKPDMKRKVHLGAKLDDGVVRASDETLRRNLALVTSQTTDAVRTFMSAAYWENQVTLAERTAGVEVADAPKVIEAVSKKLGFSAQQANDILNAFIDSGQRTSGGVMQAVTAVAQQQPSGDDQWDMELQAMAAMHEAAALARTA